MKIHRNYTIGHFSYHFTSSIYFTKILFNGCFIRKIWYWNILYFTQKFWFMLQNQPIKKLVEPSAPPMIETAFLLFCSIRLFLANPNLQNSHLHPTIK